jgi:hypothetical protein
MFPRDHYIDVKGNSAKRRKENMRTMVMMKGAYGGRKGKS